jgi:extracellular factor (EF) 3-hydroxypalmitic acid methyl ester biosynthesis protein
MSEAIEGRLLIEGERVAVKVKYASKYSLWVWLDGVEVDSQPVGLELEVGQKTVGISPCRILRQTGEEPEAGMRRLVSLDRLLDFEMLLFHSKLDEIDATFSKLSPILGYKEAIEDGFRGFVSNLTYDLNVYANHLDQIDSEYAEEPKPVKDIIQAALIRAIEPSLAKYLDTQMDALEELVSTYSAQEDEHHGYYFRKQLWNVILRSPILARTNLKPRGYNGDSEMMRMIYRNDYQGDSTFGQILHKYSIGRPAAQAVRNRRVEIAAMLKRYVQERGDRGPERIRVLSVACGPALEIQDILRSTEDAQRLHFSLLDQDELALLEVATLVDEIEASLGTKISADFIKESVRTMLVSRELKNRWGRFDFIYSMGLFDYLTAPVATAVIKKLYQLLNPQGEMVIGNFASGNPNRFFMEYWHDWKLIYRSEEEFTRLVPDLPGIEIDISTDSTGIQMLMRVAKRGVDD